MQAQPCDQWFESSPEYQYSPYKTPNLYFTPQVIQEPFCPFDTCDDGTPIHADAKIQVAVLTFRFVLVQCGNHVQPKMTFLSSASLHHL
jgi:hypothetical protein